jgi:hypothetical protein
MPASPLFHPVTTADDDDRVGFFVVVTWRTRIDTWARHPSK